jgi:hypothetical protein
MNMALFEKGSLRRIFISGILWRDGNGDFRLGIVEWLGILDV